MANSHILFQQFNNLIRLSEKERELLKTARTSLRSRILNRYQGFTQEAKMANSLAFQSQGSFVMDTIIKPFDDDDFDLDDGVYFQGNLTKLQRKTTIDYHKLIVSAIDKQREIEQIIDKDTCVRVKYFKPNGEERGFHVDLPIYYVENANTPELADKKNSWTLSSPIEFIAWFEEKTQSNFQRSFLTEELKYAEPYEKWLIDNRKKDCQLRRMVRYMKAWADFNNKKQMPSGIMMTIMVARNFEENLRDDMAMLSLLIKIKNELSLNGFKCLRPTEKLNEDLFSPFSQTEKQYFLTSLTNFINSASQAIENPNSKESCLKWQKHLGNRFPCHLAKDEIEGAKVYTAAPIKRDNSRSA